LCGASVIRGIAMVDPKMLEALRGFYSSGKFRERFAHECPPITREYLRQLVSNGFVEASVINSRAHASTTYRVTALGRRVAE
jgi:ribosomal protein S19E (S16A)